MWMKTVEFGGIKNKGKEPSNRGKRGEKKG